MPDRKRQIAEDIRQSCGASAVCIADLARYFGKQPRYVKQYLKGAPSIVFGRKRLYLAMDVAECMVKREQII